MNRAEARLGDRATRFLCVAAVAWLVMVLFVKLWVGRHVTEYAEILRSRDILSRGMLVLLLLVAAVWLLGNVIGLVLAYCGRRHSSIRGAGSAALLGLIVAIITNTCDDLSTMSGTLWAILVWVPAVTAVAVFSFAAAWRREQQTQPGLPGPVRSQKEGSRPKTYRRGLVRCNACIVGANAARPGSAAPVATPSRSRCTESPSAGDIGPGPCRSRACRIASGGS